MGLSPVWADEQGELGPVYGHQWRNFGATRRDDGTYAQNGVDQINRLLEGLRTNPYSRRHIVTGWNPLEADSEEYKYYAPGVGMVKEETVDGGEVVEIKGTFLTAEKEVTDFDPADFSDSLAIDTRRPDTSIPEQLRQLLRGGGGGTRIGTPSLNDRQPT